MLLFFIKAFTLCGSPTKIKVVLAFQLDMEKAFDNVN